MLIHLSSLTAQESLSPNEIRELRNRVQEQADTTRSIQSSFTQIRHLDFLSNDIISKGTLYFKAPNQVKWAYTEPYNYSVLFKNTTLYINDEGNKSEVDLGGSKLFQELNKLIVSSIQGNMFDENRYDISYFKEASDYQVHFKPKDSKLAQQIAVFQLLFKRNGSVSGLRLVESSGDYTDIVFAKRKINEPIPDSVFSQ